VKLISSKARILASVCTIVELCPLISFRFSIEYGNVFVLDLGGGLVSVEVVVPGVGGGDFCGEIIGFRFTAKACLPGRWEREEDRRGRVAGKAVLAKEYYY